MTKNDEMTIDQKIAKLEAMVDWFESDDFKLEEATDKFRAIKQLSEDIEKTLSDLENEITIESVEG